MNKESAYEYLANKELLTCLSKSQMQDLIRVIKDPNNENNYQIDMIKYACKDFIPKEVKRKSD